MSPNAEDRCHPPSVSCAIAIVAPVLQIQQAAAATVEVIDETAAAVGNGGAAVAADGSTLHPLFVDIDDDEYTDSVLEIHRLRCLSAYFL